MKGLVMTSDTILKIDAERRASHPSESPKMRTTFIAFAILLILGMIQVEKGERSVRTWLKARNRNTKMTKSAFEIMQTFQIYFIKAEGSLKVSRTCVLMQGERILMQKYSCPY